MVSSVVSKLPNVSQHQPHPSTRGQHYTLLKLKAALSTKMIDPATIEANARANR